MQSYKSRNNKFAFGNIYVENHGTSVSFSRIPGGFMTTFFEIIVPVKECDHKCEYYTNNTVCNPNDFMHKTSDLIFN